MNEIIKAIRKVKMGEITLENLETIVVAVFEAVEARFEDYDWQIDMLHEEISELIEELREREDY